LSILRTHRLQHAVSAHGELVLWQVRPRIPLRFNQHDHVHGDEHQHVISIHHIRDDLHIYEYHDFHDHDDLNVHEHQQ
jgi:hypothetical protein